MIGLDVDPVLLAIASATFVDDERVGLARADLRDPAWMEAVRGPQFDAVLTMTALHWLTEEVVGRLYHDIAGLMRAGGLFAHAEVMPLVDVPRLGAALSEIGKNRGRVERVGRSDWDAWWDSAASDPDLREAADQRRAVFPANYPAEEFSPSAGWHVAALRKAGFAEADVVWRSGPGAVVAAIR